MDRYNLDHDLDFDENGRYNGSAWPRALRKA
jgi:hypothetical protein